MRNMMSASTKSNYIVYFQSIFTNETVQRLIDYEIYFKQAFILYATMNFQQHSVITILFRSVGAFSA